MNKVLRDQILSRDLEDLLSELLFDRLPYVFGNDAGLCRGWRSRLAGLLQVDASEIVMIGSAAAGCSLSPYKNLKSFDDRSDVDVAVVSDYHFSEAWRSLRGLDLTLAPVSAAQRVAVKDHQSRFIYWGCIATDRILPLLPFAVQWMAARAEMAGMQPTEEREVNFRIYKDFRALRSYQLLGLKQLRQALLESEV